MPLTKEFAMLYKSSLAHTDLYIPYFEAIYYSLLLYLPDVFTVGEYKILKIIWHMECKCESSLQKASNNWERVFPHIPVRQNHLQFKAYQKNINHTKL